jgi:hypothetical protein
MLQLERYLLGDGLPEPAADEFEHQIKRRGTSDARQAIAVDHEQFVSKCTRGNSLCNACRSSQSTVQQ